MGYIRYMYMIERELRRDSNFSRKFELEKGNRLLELTIYSAVNGSAATSATSLLNNIKGRGREDGVTTVLFTRARDIMQDVVDKTGVSVNYVVSTEAPAIQNWMESSEKGGRVFRWDQIEREGDWLTAMTLIEPRER
ncbi:hypothetical protein ISS86_00960 [Candidatus Microgenomates bacterium]|nr:hypothetical protein [Candidatus Microgenomates bacterium]